MDTKNSLIFSVTVWACHTIKREVSHHMYIKLFVSICVDEFNALLKKMSICALGLENSVCMKAPRRSALKILAFPVDLVTSVMLIIVKMMVFRLDCNITERKEHEKDIKLPKFVAESVDRIKTRGGKDSKDSPIPIIAVTAHDVSMDFEKSIDAG